MIPLIPIIAAGAAAYGLAKLVKKTVTTDVALSSWLKRIGINLKTGDVFDPDMTDRHGCPILICAIQADLHDIVSQLLEAGANPDVRDQNSVPAICHAARKARANSKLIELFANAKADFNAMDAKGRNAAFYVQDSKVLKALKEHGTVINATDIDGRTPLFYAQKPKLIKEFLWSDVKINQIDNEGRTAIFYVHNPSVLEMFADSGARFNVVDNAGKTPLFFAQSVYEAMIMTNYGIDPTAVDAAGKTADIVKNPAAKQYVTHPDQISHREVLEWMSSGKNGTIDLFKQSGLMRVVLTSSTELLDAAVVNGTSYAILAIIESFKDIIADEAKMRKSARFGARKTLTEKIKKVAFERDVPEFCMAIEKYNPYERWWRASECKKAGKKRLVEWILEKPVDATLLRLEMTGEKSDDSIRYLLEKGVDPNTEVHAFDSDSSPLVPAIVFAVQHDKTQCVRELLEFGAKFDDDMHLLRYAFETMNKEIIQMLLDAGVNPNDTDHYGLPLLEVSVMYKMEDVAIKMISSGAVLDTPGHSPLVEAICRNGSPDLIQSFIDHGADIHAVDASQKMTPLQAATANNRQDVIDMLMAAGVNKS